MSKKIGILTSGGDCGGLNAVIRAATFRAINKYGWRVFGIKDGTLGLIKNPQDVIELKKTHFDGNRSAFWLKSATIANCQNDFPSHNSSQKLKKIK